MPKFFLLSIFFFLFQYSGAQVFKVDTLQYKGAPDKMIDLVILADGYTSEELDVFVEDARTMTDYILSQSPFDRYRNLFNVFIIKVPSNESGAKHPGNAVDCPEDVAENRGDDPKHFHSKMFIPNSDPDNYFGSSFDSYGMHRLVVANNEAAVYQVLESNTPFYDQAIVLVNSLFYGGSGGRIPTATAHNKSSEIAIHELAHSFANLADEYWAGVQYAAESANLTRLVRPDQVPWKKWLGHEGVGIYPYGPNAPESVWFRPHEYCKMQILAAAFCAVCQEEIVHRIHQVSNPIVGTFPDPDTLHIIDSVSYFSINLARPEPSSLETNWFLNDIRIAGSVDSLKLDPATLLSGENRLTAIVRDTTELVRTYEPPSYKAEWRVTLGDHLIEQLAAPTTLWGDTVEACYGYGTAFSIKQPYAGVEYLWYLEPEGGQPIGSGINFSTESLMEDTRYYVEAQWGLLRSARSSILVNVIPPRESPAVAIEKQEDGSLKLSISNASPEQQYSWYFTDDARLPISFRDRGAPHHITIQRGGSVVTLPEPTEGLTLYVEATDRRTTCPGPRIRVDINK